MIDSTLRRRLTLLVFAVIASFAYAQDDLSATEAPPPPIAWGRPFHDYVAGLRVERDTHAINSGFIVYYYLQTPLNVRKPDIYRQDRNLRLLAGGKLEARFFFPGLQRYADSQNIYYMPLAYISSSRVGKGKLVCFYTVPTDAGELTLTTGVLPLSFVPRGDAPADQERLVRDQSISLMKERINMLSIPRVHYRDTTLDRFRSHLRELHELYDPYNVAVNLIWAPATIDGDRPIQLEINDTTLEQLIQEIAVQTDLHYTVDTAAVIIHADPDAVRKVEINIHDHVDIRARLQTMQLHSFVVTRRTVGSLIESLNALSRQNDPERRGAAFTHSLPDNLLEQKVAMDLTEVNIYEVVRYIALTAGLHFELNDDGVVFRP
jgi:hypothetical protein